METTDQQILNLLKNEASHEQGFRQLLLKYQERLYWHIRRMVFDHEDANDVVQNTMIKVYRSIDRFEGKSQLYTWLYRIATNESITFLNQKKRKKTDSIDQEGQNIGDKLTADPYFDGNDIQRRLQKALTTLPNKQRLVFNMRYYDEMPYAEIEAVLGTSVGALKASYHHAVKKIEHYFREVESE